MKRRDFIRQTTATMSLASTVNIQNMSLFHQYQPNFLDESDKILVLVQLFGGNDGLNTIIPVEIDSYYSQYRKKINIPKSNALALPNTNLAMHPSLKVGKNEGLYGLYKEGKLAIVQGMGYDNPSFSHFRSMDVWLSGLAPANDGELLDSGWLGRYFDKFAPTSTPDAPFAIHVGNTPSLLFQGKSGAYSVLVEDPDAFFAQAEGVVADIQNQNLSAFFGSEYNFIKDIAFQSNFHSKSIKTAFDKGKNIENYPSQSLSNQLKLVARLISGGLKSKVYFVGIGGFDTHSSQGGVGGIHAQLLADVSEAISTFMADVDKLGLSNRIVGMTISEFGRRPEENKGFGTDHGTAGVMFAFGNAVKGKIFGQPLLSTPLAADNNFVHQFDYRQVYYETIATWFGNSQDDAKQILNKRFKLIDDGIFKGTNPEDFIVKTPVVSQIDKDAKDTFVLMPNPVVYEAILQANLLTVSTLSIRQLSSSGKFVTQLYQANEVDSGQTTIKIQLQGSAGLYFLEIIANDRKYYLKVVKL